METVKSGKHTFTFRVLPQFGEVNGHRFKVGCFVHYTCQDENGGYVYGGLHQNKNFETLIFQTKEEAINSVKSLLTSG